MLHDNSTKRGFSRYFGILFVALLSQACASYQCYAATDSPSPYVSDQFKVVAKRVLGKVVSDQVKNACPQNDVLCQNMAIPLGRALQAAITSNDPKLKKSLNTFFINSSAGALTHVILKNSSDISELPEWGNIHSRLSQCVSSAVIEPNRVSPSCLFSSTETVAALKLMLGKRCDNNPRVANVCDLVNRVGAKQPVSPALAVRSLADLAILDGIDRPDVRIYLLSLERFLNYGVDDGVFGAARAFLADDENVRQDSEALINSTPDAPENALWDKTEDSQWLVALSSCAMSSETFKIWQQARDERNWVENSRLAYLKGEPIDASPMEGLLSYKPDSCVNQDAKEKIRSFKRQTLYALSPIRVQESLSHYGVAALAAAAIIDYVRTDDEEAFQKNLLQTYAYGLAQIAYRRLVLNKLAEELSNPSEKRLDSTTLPSFKDAERTCEVAVVSSLLGLNSEKDSDGCYSIALSTRIAHQALTPSAENIPSRDWLAKHASDLDKAFGALLVQQVELATSTVAMPDTAILFRVGNALRNGKLASASEILVRPGVSFLTDSLDTLTSSWLKADYAECSDNARVVSIFSHSQGKCALQLLIASAYRPIADYYGESGGVKRESSEVAQDVYDNLMKSPAINRLPIIFNVGVGANHIMGHSSVWGDNGYSALTVVDKVGVAFLKKTHADYEWEFGAFAGGFLDAVVRTAANTGKSERYWLLGLTGGWTRLPHFPFGIEVHLAEAMPFRLDSGGRYGLTIGAAIVVPWNVFLGVEE